MILYSSRGKVNFHHCRVCADKVAVVVGGATGIGAATAARLGGEGCRVVIGDIAEDAARQTAERIAAAGGTATHVAFDLADPGSVADLIDAAATTYDGVDLLFNVGADMSAIRADTDVVDIDFDVWDRVMTVNLRGYVAAMKYAIPRMLDRGAGPSSTCPRRRRSRASRRDRPTPPPRPASARSPGTSRRGGGKEGIRCNAVAPGFTATEAIRSVPQWLQLEPGALKRIRGTRVGDPDDIAALVAFLLSEEGEWINGQVINIDGGTVLR